jgi:hypothetical protein
MFSKIAATHANKYCMKPGFITFFYCLLLSACNGMFAKDKVRDSLPGTYINQSSGNYSIAFDTLIISKENDGGNSFSIERKVSFQKIRHGVLQSKEYHLEHWLAVYDDKIKVLTETKKGRMMTYVPEKKKLYLANNIYIKIES